MCLTLPVKVQTLFKEIGRKKNFGKHANVFCPRDKLKMNALSSMVMINMKQLPAADEHSVNGGETIDCI